MTFNAPRAEIGLVRQGELELLINDADQVVSLVAPAGQSLIMLTDPIASNHCVTHTLDTLHKASQDRFVTPCLYKCNGRTAVIARQAGWSLLQISQDAIIQPLHFDINTRACRQLRRVLRKAETENVTISLANAVPPFDEMRMIAKAWGLHRKSARGFSMGRFDEDYVSAQRIYLAHKGTDLIGFVSFHESWRERALDLMCCMPCAPKGTSHALIYSAINDAAQDRLPRLSLAAVPCIANHLPLPSKIRDRLNQKTGAPGLMRFKSSFNPTWEPLYLAAPSRVGLILAGIDLADRITRPRKTAQNSAPNS